MSQSPAPRFTPDPEHRFFIYCPENAEFFCFATAAERDQYSDTVVQAYLDDGWDDTVERVVAGELTHTCAQVDRYERPPEHEIDEGGNDLDGNFWAEGWDYRCNYELQPMAPVATSDAVQQLVAVRTLSAAVKLYKAVLGAHVDQFAAGTLDADAYRVLRAQWETALLQTTRNLSCDPVAPAGQVVA